MKKGFTLLGLIFICSLSISAQVVRVGIVGIGLGGGDNSGRLALHLIEASFAPRPNFDFGAYYGAQLAGNDTGASAGIRYGIQGKYYLLTDKFKPFVGVQAGLNNGLSIDLDTEAIGEAGTKFQITPQAGFRFGPLNIWASYQSGFMFNGGLVFGFGKFK